MEAAKLGMHCSWEDDILNGRCSLVFGSPEAWLMNEKWRQMLDSEVYRSRLFGIVRGRGSCSIYGIYGNKIIIIIIIIYMVILDSAPDNHYNCSILD